MSSNKNPPPSRMKGGLWSIVTLSPDQRHFAHFDKNARLHPNEIHPGADFSSEVISTVPNHQTSARVHEAIRRSPDFPTEKRIEASGLCVWFCHNTNLPDLLVRISSGTLSKHSHNLSFDSIVKIAHAFGLSLNALFSFDVKQPVTQDELLTAEILGLTQGLEPEAKSLVRDVVKSLVEGLGRIS